MRTMKCLAAAGLLALCGASAAAEMQTANTMKLAEGEKGASATIADIAWFAGSWSGPGLGGLAEETWSEPRGGRMHGMFRLLKQDQPQFYELMVLEESEGSLVLRLKHFNPDLRGWEERGAEASVTFPLVTKQGSRMYFNGVTFERQGDDAVTVYLAIHGKNGVREEKSTYTRQKAT